MSTPLDELITKKRMAQTRNTNIVLLSEIRLQIEAGFRRRNEMLIEEVFKTRKDDFTGLMSLEAFREALNELDMHRTEIDILSDFQSMSTKSGGLDLRGFKAAVSISSPIAQWASTLPIAEIIADSLPIYRSQDPLRELSQIENDQLEISFTAMLEGLKKLFHGQIDHLAKSMDAWDQISQDSTLSTKFQIENMTAGKIGDFYGGLASRTGKKTEVI
jgi:hypothetical protein